MAINLQEVGRTEPKYVFLKEEQLERSEKYPRGTYFWEVFKETKNYREALREFAREGKVVKIEKVAEVFGFSSAVILEFLKSTMLRPRRKNITKR